MEIAKTIQGKFPKASLKIGFPFTTEKVFYDRNTIPATLKGVEVVAPLPEKFKNKQHKWDEKFSVDYIIEHFYTAVCYMPEHYKVLYQYSGFIKNIEFFLWVQSLCHKT